MIVDDEAPARRLLANYIEQAGLTLLASLASPVEALQQLRSLQPDLLFVDISMPGISGLELIRSLNPRPLLVVTTAHSEHALECFDLDVVDYLKKPYPLARFMQAVRKAEERLAPAPPPRPDHFFVKSDYQLVKIDYRALQCVEGLGEYVKLHTASRTVVSLLSLQRLTEELPANDFIRVHKSFLVNFSFIESFQQSTLWVGGREVPVGQTYKTRLLEALKARGIF
jgi:DNA-binding LytR/AlgR family response regulator